MTNKIKTFMLLLGMLLLSTNLNAEWETITFKEHVDTSSLIVVAEFEKEIEKKKVDIGMEQLVSFEVNQTIKGDINGSFLVKGQELFICMPQMIFPTTPKAQYLLFLNQEGNNTHYDLVHGERSALLIENNGTLGWIKNREKIDLGEVVTMPLLDVVEEIKENLKD